MIHLNNEQVTKHMENASQIAKYHHIKIACNIDKSCEPQKVKKLRSKRLGENLCLVHQYDK